MLQEVLLSNEFKMMSIPFSTVVKSVCWEEEDASLRLQRRRGVVACCVEILGIRCCCDCLDDWHVLSDSFDCASSSFTETSKTIWDNVRKRVDTV